MKTLICTLVLGAFAIAANAGGEACAAAAKDKAASQSCCPASKAKLETTKAATCPATGKATTTTTKTAPVKKESPKANNLASK